MKISTSLLTSRLVVRLVAVAIVLFAAACAVDPGTPDGGTGRVDGGADGGGPTHRAPAALQTCAASPGAVSSISQTLARLNALPKPVSGACFVASLQRPLSVVATSSVLSLQPAVSRETPRLFVLSGQVVLSVVPGGDAGQLLELAEWVTPLRTLKGEVELPVAATLAASAPYARIKVSANATTCGVCHRQEAPSATVTDGFDSAAFRPAPGELVPVTELAGHHDRCVDAGTVSERCDWFHAFFDFGEVRQGAFGNNVELFIP
jgi:hypothetical protein